jgi:hypothetical protein
MYDRHTDSASTSDDPKAASKSGLKSGKTGKGKGSSKGGVKGGVIAVVRSVSSKADVVISDNARAAIAARFGTFVMAVLKKVSGTISRRNGS